MNIKFVNNIDFESFRQEILNELNKQDNIKMEELDRVKDGKLCHGLFNTNGRTGSLSGSIVYYLDEDYANYLKGAVSIQDIIKEILYYMKQDYPQMQSAQTILDDYNIVKEHLTPRLINPVLHKEQCEDAPYRPFLDLAITYRVEFVTGDAKYSVLVENAMLEKYEITEEELFVRSFNNLTNEKFFIKVIPTDDGETMLIANEDDKYGAIAMLVPGLMDHILQRGHKDLIIVPISVHSIIVMTNKTGFLPENLKAMKHQLRKNNQNIYKDVMLSNNLYKYSMKDKTFSII